MKVKLYQGNITVFDGEGNWIAIYTSSDDLDIWLPGSECGDEYANCDEALADYMSYIASADGPLGRLHLTDDEKEDVLLRIESAVGAIMSDCWSAYEAELKRGSELESTL